MKDQALQQVWREEWGDSTNGCEYSEWLEDRLEQSLLNIISLRKYAEETFGYWDSDNDHKVGKRLQSMAGRMRGYSSDIDEAMREAMAYERAST